MDTFGWVPMRWPCGPLEIERGKRREGFSAREAEALREWCEPRVLERLEGSPVNCLVVSWADGSAGDESQQRALVPLVATARQRGLAVVGWVADSADLRRAADAAQAAGLSALASESREPVPGMGVLRFRERGLADRSAVGLPGRRRAGVAWPAGDGGEGRRRLDRPHRPALAGFQRLVRPSRQEPGGPAAALARVRSARDRPARGGRFVRAGDRRHRDLRRPLAGVARPAPAARPGAGARLGARDLGRDRSRPRLLPEAARLDGLRPGRADWRRLRLCRAERVPVVRGAEPARPAGRALPHPRNAPRGGRCSRAAPREASLDGLDAVLYVDPSPPQRISCGSSTRSPKPAGR